jgi:hypothetical protein
MLFEEKVDLKTFWKHVIDQGWIGGTLESDEDILRSGIGRHISYRNMTAIRINRLVHCDMYKQPYVHEVFDGTHFLVRSIMADGGRKCEVGERCTIEHLNDATMSLKFSKSGTIETFALEGMAERMIRDGHRGTVKDYLLFAVGQYMIRVYQKGLTRNTLVGITGLPSEENKQKYQFRNPAKEKDVTVKRSTVNEHTFRFPYAKTAHSSQGSTIYERYCVHGMEGRNVSPKVVWTVITRGVQLRNLYLGRVLEREPSTRDFENYAKAKLSAYVESDRKANRYDASPGAYSLHRMADMCKGAYMRRCSGLCGEGCDNVMDLVPGAVEEAISFDRIDCAKGHTIHNLRAVCMACNRRAQDRDEGY